MPPDRNTRTLPVDAPLGDRLRSIRLDAGLSQEDLAAETGAGWDRPLSVSLIKAIEQGRRNTPRLSTLTRLADALDVDLSDLVGRRPRLDHGDDGPAVLAIRDAISHPDHLPGLAPAGDDAVPRTVDELRRDVAQGWARYWGGDFAGLAGILPALIGEARATRHAAGTGAAGPVAQTYQLAACLLTQIGRDDLGLLAAERAIRAAHEGDDEAQWATVTGTFAWVLLHQGRFDESEALAAGVAGRIEPARWSTADDHTIAAWGNLLVTALAPRAAAERDVSDLISLALAAGERLGRRVDVYETAFGPTSARMQAVHAWSVLREPGKALDVARNLNRADLRGISVGAHLLDVGRSHLDARHHKAATMTMHEARAVSGAAWFRHQPIAGSVVSDLVERERRLTPELRSLANTLNLR